VVQDLEERSQTSVFELFEHTRTHTHTHTHDALSSMFHQNVVSYALDHAHYIPIDSDFIYHSYSKPL